MSSRRDVSRETQSIRRSIAMGTRCCSSSSDSLVDRRAITKTEYRDGIRSLVWVPSGSVSVRYFVFTRPLPVGQMFKAAVFQWCSYCIVLFGLDFFYSASDNKLVTSPPSAGVRSVRSIAMNVSVSLWVCLSVCLLAYISKSTRRNVTKFSVHVTCGRDDNAIRCGLLAADLTKVRYRLPNKKQYRTKLRYDTTCHQCNFCHEN